VPGENAGRTRASKQRDEESTGDVIMPELQLSQNALRVLEARYLRRDAQRRIIETPEELFDSVARGVAYAELLLGNARRAQYWQETYHHLLTSLDFLPNTPTLMNAGKPLGQLSACFVLPVEDSIEDIFEAVKQMALVQRTGGGTGFSFSRLRPKGDIVETTAGEASGPVSFMRIFDCATENIKQGGKRRGANMGVLRVDHPDILDFIWAKQDGVSLRNFNVSVGVTDAFMEAVRKDKRYALVHPRGRSAANLRATERLGGRVTRGCSFWTPLTGPTRLPILDLLRPPILAVRYLCFHLSHVTWGPLT
jgi:ribonucleoside-diphosphate reductase alpha chain